MLTRPQLEWQPEDYIRALRLHKWMITLVTLAAGGLVAIYMSAQPSIYQATARILIETHTPQIIQFQEVSPYTQPWDRAFLQTEYQVISSRAVLSRVVEELHLAAFPPFSNSTDPVSFLQEMISVNPVRGTKLVDISVTGVKRELITQIANAIADTYAAINLERRRGFTTGGAQWLREEVAKMEVKMRSDQLALQEFREANSTMDFGEEHQNNVLQRIQALNAALTNTRKKRIESETKYRERHPNILELLAEEKELQLALFDQEQLGLEMSRLSIQYNTLLREAKTSEQIYNTLLTRLKELTVQEGIQTNNVHVVDYARVPEESVGPHRLRVIGTAVILGLLLGIGLAFLREFLVKTVRTRREFEQLVEIPFLGHIPLIRLPRKRGKPARFVLSAESDSPVAESIRTIRTTLEFLLPAGKPRVLLVTSSLPEEGKSLVALNLATSLRELGRKVLLVDGDLRRPTLHQVLQVELEPGLSGYLQEKASLEELVRVAPHVNHLPVVPAGLTPPQPTDLLSGPRLKELLEKWKEEYQYVIIDSPPILVAADAAVLATAVDEVIFVLRADKTFGEAALAGKQRLVDVGTRLIGGVLNGVRLELERGYRYYYYYRSKASR